MAKVFGVGGTQKKNGKTTQNATKVFPSVFEQETRARERKLGHESFFAAAATATIVNHSKLAYKELRLKLVLVFLLVVVVMVMAAGLAQCRNFVRISFRNYSF